MPLYNTRPIFRNEWGALPPTGEIPEMEHPGLHVTLTLKTDFEECTTKEDCMKKVQQMQKLHMEEWGLPDIAYNFIVGNDGHIYEGRGWNLRSAKAIGNPSFDDRTFDIGVIGDYTEDIPDDVYYLTMSLLKYGVQFKLVDEDYTYVGHIDKDPLIK